jgi:hypothetical protein
MMAACGDGLSHTRVLLIVVVGKERGICCLRRPKGSAVILTFLFSKTPEARTCSFAKRLRCIDTKYGRSDH